MQIYQWIDVTRQTIKQLCMLDKAAKKIIHVHNREQIYLFCPLRCPNSTLAPLNFESFHWVIIFDLPFLFMIGFKLSPSPNDRDRCLSKGAFDLEGNSETWIKISFCNDLWRGLSIVISLLGSCWCKQRVCVWSNLPSYRHNRIVVVFSRSFASETDIGQLLFFFCQCIYWTKWRSSHNSRNNNEDAIVCFEAWRLFTVFKRSLLERKHKLWTSTS